MRSMSDRVFIDTNVLVYAYDEKEGTKQQTAKQILNELWQERSGVLSIQVCRSSITR